MACSCTKKADANAKRAKKRCQKRAKKKCLQNRHPPKRTKKTHTESEKRSRQRKAKKRYRQNKKSGKRNKKSGKRCHHVQARNRYRQKVSKPVASVASRAASSP